MGHKFLIAAYAITWILQLGYAGWLVLRTIELKKAQKNER
jgi:hypothetical protein